MYNTQIKFIKVIGDINGNPRYVCHFLDIANNYDEALKIAKKIGGKKYHTKTFGGGIVFKTPNIRYIDNLLTSLSYKFVEYWRNPTKSEIKMGYGAIHKVNFSMYDVSKPNGELKQWFIKDKLRYNRS